eukprot:g14911.t1
MDPVQLKDDTELQLLPNALSAFLAAATILGLSSKQLVTLPLLLDATTDLFGEKLQKKGQFAMKAVILILSTILCVLLKNAVAFMGDLDPLGPRDKEGMDLRNCVGTPEPAAKVDPWTASADPWQRYKQMEDRLRADMRHTARQEMGTAMHVDSDEPTLMPTRQDARIEQLEIDMQELKSSNEKFHTWFQDAADANKQLHQHVETMHGVVEKQQQDLEQLKTDVTKHTTATQEQMNTLRSEVRDEFSSGFSRLEAMLEKRVRTSLLILVTFGKHKGEKLSDVLEEDPAYCVFIVDAFQSGDSVPSPALAEAAEWLLGHNSDLNNEDTKQMGFGKHKAETRESVIQNDPDYANWVIKRVQEAEEKQEDVYLPMKTFARYAQNCFESQ